MKIKAVYIIFALMMLIVAYVNAQSERNIVREGNKQYNEKKFKDAETNYKKSIEKNPQTFEGNYNLGNALYRQKKYEDAARQYMQSAGVKSDKDNQADSYYNMGNAFMQSEKYKESVEAYKMALRNNPKNEDARYNLSYALSKLRQQQQQQQQQQNKDQKKDQKQQDQKQQQQQQKQEQQKQEQAKQQQQRQPKISKEDAERMLQALKNDEKDLQKKKAKRYDTNGARTDKDW